MTVVETKRRTQPAVVNELHNGIQFIQPVFKWCSREHKRKCRTKTFDHAAGLRLPILNPLAFIKNNEIPLHAFDRQDVAQNLFVIAHGEEAVVGVLGSSRGNTAGDQLAIAVTEAPDFASPLRFHRCWANDEHLGYAGFTREEFSHTDGLDGLSKSHLVGENGAPCAGGECDTVQLIRQQFGLKKPAPQTVRLRLDSNLGDTPRDPFEQEPTVDEFFGVRVNVDAASLPFETLYPSEQIGYVVDVPAAQVFKHLSSFRVELLRQKEPERRAIAVLNVDANRLACVRPLQLRGRETPAQLRQHMQNVLTGSKRVRTEVRTGAIRAPRFAAADRDAVGLAGNRAADGVIRPRLVRIGGLDRHPLRACPLPPFIDGLPDELLFGQTLDRHALGRRHRQAQGHLFVENECESGADMLAQ